MATVLFILILLAGYHFVIENIILPVMRDELKCRFVALRDKLIMLKIQDRISDNVFNQLNIIICTSANNIHHFDLFNLAAPSGKKPRHRIKSEELFEFLSNSQDKEIKSLFNMIIRYAGKAFVINSIAWILYIIPLLPLFIVVILSYTGLRRLVKKKKTISRYAKAKRVLDIISKQQSYSKEIFIEIAGNSHSREFLPG
jgi:hypothetical protein